ncbi:Peptidase M20 domain-containing protein 2 [Fusarium keratoplasticum]|nr:Peptidase M20 domain-containing protein 2 [Fusarium keratoplasticum]
MTAILVHQHHNVEPSSKHQTDESLQMVRRAIASTIDAIDKHLLAVNNGIHSHPELCYQEVFAHATITDFLESQGFKVQRHAYGLDTSFVAEAGSGGRLVIFCAEYDALPDVGHGCGHNLIATASITAFVGAASALLALGIAGRVRILGTPAEEGGGGKVKLIDAGAFADDLSAALMCHAMPAHQVKDGKAGIAAFRTLASRRLGMEFFGKNAHAGQEPWSGINALDAAVSTYTTVSMLRQQIKPHQRVQGVIEEGGKVPNIIPDYTRMTWGVRSFSSSEVDALSERVEACANGAAKASGCTVKITRAVPYKELRVNEALSMAYVSEMASLAKDVLYEEDEPSSAGTDMGNVSHVVPSFHGIFAIPTPPGVPCHNRAFADAAGTIEAHREAVKAGKGMAMVAIRVLDDADLAARVKHDFGRRSG